MAYLCFKRNCEDRQKQICLGIWAKISQLGSTAKGHLVYTSAICEKIAADKTT